MKVRSECWRTWAGGQQSSRRLRQGSHMDVLQIMWVKQGLAKRFRVKFVLHTNIKTTWLCCLLYSWYSHHVILFVLGVRQSRARLKLFFSVIFWPNTPPSLFGNSVVSLGNKESDMTGKIHNAFAIPAFCTFILKHLRCR